MNYIKKGGAKHFQRLKNKRIENKTIVVYEKKLAKYKVISLQVNSVIKSILRILNDQRN